MQVILLIQLHLIDYKK